MKTPLKNSLFFLILILLFFFLSSSNEDDSISSKTNLISQNQNIYIIPEDFDMGILYDPINSAKETENLFSIIDSYINSVTKGIVQNNKTTPDSLFFIRRELEENLFLSGRKINEYRIGNPNVNGNLCETDFKLFSSGRSARGTLYCIKLPGSDWMIEDIEIDYSEFDNTEKKRSFLPVPRGEENFILTY